MNGWDGDTQFWRAEAGALVGETTEERRLSENTFLIWRGGEVADFELKLEYRMSSTNSGIQYRSRHLPPGTANVTGRWVLAGYQADIDYGNNFTGGIFEERGRGFLARRGTFGYAGPSPTAATPSAGPGEGGTGQPAGLRGSIGSLESADVLRTSIKQGDWNEVHIIARGRVLAHIINGHVMAVAVDDDAANRAASGLLGLQLHTGAPMKIEFRNIFLKRD
jgi:hypothetical protein